MARQKLIHLHTSGLTSTALIQTPDGLSLGEIAVQHNETAPKLIVRLSDETNGAVLDTLAEFIDKSAVEALIDTAQTDLETSIQAINDKIGGNFDSTNTVAKAISDEADARANKDEELEDAILDNATAITAVRSSLEAEIQRATSAESEISAAVEVNAGAIEENASDISDLEEKLDGFDQALGSVKKYIDDEIDALGEPLKSISAQNGNDYITVTVGAKTSARTQSVGVAVGVAEVSAATALKQGLADAYDVKLSIKKVSDDLGNLDATVDTISDMLAGFNQTEGSVKTYVDDKVADAITSVYKVKGSVLTYNDLPATGLTEGDVYNVESEATVDGKYYPAGTNWVWVDGTPSGHWDPLGGTIDLSPYALSADVQTHITSADTKFGQIDGDITNLKDGLSAETAARVAADTALTASLSAETYAREQAVNSLEDEDERLAGLIADEVTARTTAINTLTSSAETLQTNIANEVQRATGAETVLRNQITAETAARIAADSAITDSIDALEGDSKRLENLITAETAARVSADTQHDNSIQNLNTSINNINDKIGEGFSAQSTIASQLSAVKSTADSAVQSVVVSNTATNGITATKSGTTVTLNFDEMVIDCGTY